MACVGAHARDRVRRSERRARRKGVRRVLPARDRRRRLRARAHPFVGDYTGPASTPVGDIFADSTGVPCAAGTTNVGVADGYHRNSLIRIRLCSVPNLTSTSEESTPGSRYYIAGSNGKALVNSRVSGAVLAMVDAARGSGVPISVGSSYRTMGTSRSCGATTPTPPSWPRRGPPTTRWVWRSTSPCRRSRRVDLHDLGHPAEQRDLAVVEPERGALGISPILGRVLALGSAHRLEPLLTPTAPARVPAFAARPGPGSERVTDEEPRRATSQTTCAARPGDRHQRCTLRQRGLGTSTHPLVSRQAARRCGLEIPHRGIVARHARSAAMSGHPLRGTSGRPGC